MMMGNEENTNEDLLEQINAIAKELHSFHSSTEERFESIERDGTSQNQEISLNTTDRKHQKIDQASLK